jgi:fatty-acyl-CoA synthase
MSYQADWIKKWASYSPIKTAIRMAGTDDCYTYSQLDHISAHLSYHLLEKLGLRKGDRIAVLAEFSIEYVALFATALKSGIVLVPLNYRLTGPELDYIIDNASPGLIITDEKYKGTVAGQDAYTRVTYHWSMLELSRLIEGYLSDQTRPNCSSEPIKVSDPLFILYTSGTTGFPKGAIYSHKMAFWNSINTQMRLDITANDHTLVCMPPFHTGGWNVLLTPFLHHGASISLMNKFDADEVLTILEDEEATLFMGVPTMLKMMAEADTFDKVDLEPLRYFIVGGEAMPIPLIETWQNKGIPIRQGYGLTEVGPNITSLHHDDVLRKIGSIGKPNFYVDTKLITTEGKEACVDEEGELWISGPMVTPGYWNNDNATRDAIEDGWFKTGDVLVADSEGYYYVKDRIKNMFISGGENVYPAEVEKVIQQHEAVREVAVIAVPDTKWGEVGKALVVPSDSGLSAETLMQFCQERLAKFKIPKYYEFVASIPRNESGKIDRKSIAKQL